MKVIIRDERVYINKNINIILIYARDIKKKNEEDGKPQNSDLELIISILEVFCFKKLSIERVKYLRLGLRMVVDWFTSEKESPESGSSLEFEPRTPFM